MTDNAAFIDHLITLAAPERDRGPLAILRRGASGETRDLARLYPLVLPWAPRDSSERAYIQTACLFGLHPTKPSDQSRALSLGQAFRRSYLDTGSRPSVEGRFIALLRCHQDELVEHLRHAIALIKDTQVPLRWTDVLFALQRWESAEDSEFSPQRQWARDFWGFTKTVDNADNAEELTTDTTGAAT